MNMNCIPNYTMLDDWSILTEREGWVNDFFMEFNNSMDGRLKWQKE